MIQSFEEGKALTGCGQQLIGLSRVKLFRQCGGKIQYDPLLAEATYGEGLERFSIEPCSMEQFGKVFLLIYVEDHLQFPVDRFSILFPLLERRRTKQQTSLIPAITTRLCDQLRLMNLSSLLQDSYRLNNFENLKLRTIS